MYTLLLGLRTAVAPCSTPGFEESTVIPKLICIVPESLRVMYTQIGRGRFLPVNAKRKQSILNSRHWPRECTRFLSTAGAEGCYARQTRQASRLYRASTAAPGDESSGLDAVVGQGVRTLACRSLVKRATTASAEKTPAPKIRTMSEANRNV